MNPDNPVTQRLEKLQAQWQEFVDEPAAKVFRWMFLAEELPVYHGFADAENEDAGCTNDVFLEFRDSFANDTVHGFRLAANLQKVFQEAEQPEATGDGFPGPWVCPPRTAQDLATPYFLKCLKSFCDHYKDFLENVALVMLPESVSKMPLYVEWIAAFAQAPLPPQVRLLLLDDPSMPVYGTLAQKVPPGLVHTESANLEMGDALEELADEGDDAGAAFRRHYVAMTNQVGKKDMPKAEEHAKGALAITQADDIPHLEPSIYMTLAAGYQALGKFETALERYRSSKASADRSIAHKDPGAHKLKVQSIFGECGALIFLKRFDEAGPLYQEAAAVSLVAEDKPMALEAHRMAAFCYAKDSAWDDAWREGNAAITVAEGLERGELPKTGARFAARDLHKLSRKWRFSGEQRDEVDTRLERLLGPDWQLELEKELEP